MLAPADPRTRVEEALSWQGRGARVPLDAPVATLRQLAGLSWEPQVLPLTYRLGETEHIARDRVLVRDDTGAELTRVGPDYVPVQNAQVVAFFQAYAAAGGLTLEALGSLGGGCYVWALARLGESFTLPGADRVESYVLLCNPHLYGKGPLALTTLLRAVSGSSLQPRAARVTRLRLDLDAPAVQARVAAARAQVATARAEAEQLAATRLTLAKAQAQLIALLGNPALAWERQPRMVHDIWALYQGQGRGATLGSAAGTAWGLLQALAEHVDWQHGRDPDRRLQQAWFPGGWGTTLKRAAGAALLAQAKRKKT